MEKSCEVQQLRRSSTRPRNSKGAARLLLPLRFTAVSRAAAAAAVSLCLALFLAAMAMPVAGVAASGTGTGYDTAAKKAIAARKGGSGEGLGAAASDVITVTADNYTKTIMEGTWFVKFYTDWCTHCQRLQPTWEELATQMKGKVNVGQVNCDKERELCRRFRVRGYPTLVHVHNRRSRNYQKSRSIESLVAFATKGYKTAPAVSALKSPFGPLENTKARAIKALVHAKGLVLEQVEMGTPMWVVCVAAFALLVVTTVIVAVVVVTAKRPKQD